MEKLFEKIKKAKKKINSKKANIYVRKYYKKNINSKSKFERNFWKKNDYWDFFFQSTAHSVNSDKFVPLDYYNYKVLPNLNDPYTRIYVQDKNMFDKTFGNMGVRLPKTIFRCMNNVFMDGDYNEIENIDEYIENISEDIIVKRARNSGGGDGVEKFIYKNESLISVLDNKRLDANKFLTNFKGDFIVQEIIQQHEDLGKFHPHSLNTIKIMTYRSVKTNKVSALMAVLRIGNNKSFVDNNAQGGLIVGIEINSSKDASLRESGFFEIDDVHLVHPDTKIEFKNSKISNFNLVIRDALKLSNAVPYQRIIGWDFSINENGEPVLVESNYGSFIEGLQLANGEPIFGVYSDEVKEYLDKC